MEHNHDQLHRRHARAAHPEPNPNADANANPHANPVQTVVSVIYVTKSKTFSGSASYSTLTSSTSSDPPSTTPSSAPTETSSQGTSSTDLPSSIMPASSSVAASLGILADTATPSSSSTSATLPSSASATGSTASSDSSSGGMSTAGKAGLAIGILLILGTVLALLLFFFKKRRDSHGTELMDDEKDEIFSGAGRQASTRTNATAPRLSLRPVTQFLPNLGEMRNSRGNILSMASTPRTASPGPRHTGSAWERQIGGQDQNRSNPFGNHAETIDTANANGPAVVDSVGPGGEIHPGGAAPVGLTRGASKRENTPKQLDFTKAGPFQGPPSPATTEFSISSEVPGTPTPTKTAAAIAAAGGPANSSVHRVQLDFKPSMDDELELRAGDLIRVLHEYDDGWALCIRLDRSQQGVAPRTCLSTRPVKPRPQQNGPRGAPPPGMRVPQQQQYRSMSPAMNQSAPGAMSPAVNRSMTPTGRPMTPNGPQQPLAPNNHDSPANPFSEYDDAGSVPEFRGSPTVVRKPVGQAL